jgi:hypothetical protein
VLKPARLVGGNPEHAQRTTYDDRDERREDQQEAERHHGFTTDNLPGGG